MTTDESDFDRSHLFFWEICELFRRAGWSPEAVAALPAPVMSDWLRERGWDYAADQIVDDPSAFIGRGKYQMVVAEATAIAAIGGWAIRDAYVDASMTMDGITGTENTGRL
jgi:hypothetical protein